MSDIPTRCLKCEGDLIVLLVNVPPPHWGKLVCSKCQAYVQWIGLPDKERKQTVKKRVLKESDKTCCFCGQEQQEMKNKNFLSVDHQTQLNHGGEDSDENAWILCDACHKLKNWLMIHGRNKYRATIKKEDDDERRGYSENT